MHKNVKLKTSPVYKENFTSIKRCIKMLSQKLAKKIYKYKNMHKNVKLKTSPVYKENFTSIKICIKMLS